MNIWRVPYPKFGAGPGLERVKQVAAQLNLDLAGFGQRGVVIVGSNGKGSTAAMTAALLGQAAPNVGLFISPHLLDLNERYRIGAEDISDAELGEHWRRVDEAIAACELAETMGGFEFLFLIAADWFQARGCAYTVWEAGLGGRLDPTRLIEARHVALTSLDFEHTELLGSTLREIALEKVAVAAPGARLAISEAIAANGKVHNAIAHWCEKNGVMLSTVPALSNAPLAGAHQQSNAGLAVWLARSLAPLDTAQVRSGFDATRWPGRLEMLSRDPLEVIDVGHTPDGVRASLSGFRAMHAGGPSVLVCGVSADKDVAGIVSALAPGFDVVVCAPARHKGAPPALIAAHAQSANPDAEIVLADSVAEARRLALAKAAGGAIYAAGGLFLAAEYKAVHLGRDPASLAFF
jgi:dihydrofolate synthase/folylpolyglutamate synthase